MTITWGYRFHFFPKRCLSKAYSVPTLRQTAGFSMNKVDKDFDVRQGHSTKVSVVSDLFLKNIKN